MPHVHRTKLWQVALPDDWRASSGEALVTLWNPEGVGTLTVLTTDENKAPPRNAKAQEFIGTLQGRTYESLSADRFSRHWTLLCGGQWIYVRYSCATKNAESERVRVDEIVRSISETV